MKTMPFFLLIAIIIAILAVAFALVNATPVTVSLVFTEFNSSLALVLLVTLGIGILIGFLGLLPGIIRNRWQIAKYKREIHRLEADTQKSREIARPDPETTGKPAPPPDASDI